VSALEHDDLQVSPGQSGTQRIRVTAAGDAENAEILQLLVLRRHGKVIGTVHVPHEVDEVEPEAGPVPRTHQCQRRYAAAQLR
jgi:hypothetical protein